MYEKENDIQILQIYMKSNEFKTKLINERIESNETNTKQS